MTFGLTHAPFDSRSPAFGSRTFAQGRPDYPIKPVPFTKVHLNDIFWAPRIEINRTASIPSAFEQCELTGRVNLFERAATVLRGEALNDKRPPGYPFDETDLYKVIEGASYSLSVTPDPKLDAYVDGLIAKIAAAQEPDGYIYTTRTIDPKNPHRWAGPERWVFERDDSHELYDLGHLFEAAVAHHLATGKRTLLDVAIKAADLLVATFGPGKRTTWPGHQITEMALVRLYRVTGTEAYLSLAKFLLDERGPGPYPEGERANPRGLNYNQAHLKVVEQSEPVGHAVRAVYMYSGMADVAAVTGDEKMRAAGKRIWDYLIASKLYLTGGIGASGSGEAFGQPYELPNMTAYNETCASVGMDFWNHRLFLLEGDAKYIDVMERTLYNGLVSGVSLDGKTFFYPNPLESNGQHARQEWFGVACCPGNITRFMPSVPGYLYATRGDSVYVNLFAKGTANIDLPGGAITIEQDTRYPWDGAVEDDRRRRTQPRGAFAINVRIPGWARNEPVPSDLYVYTDEIDVPAASLRVNGSPVPMVLDKGFVTVDRTWSRGDVIDARPADAGAPHRLQHAGDGQSRPRRVAARAHRVRRRVAGQPQRQGAQHRAARWQRAQHGIPRRPAERRAGDPRPRHRARARRERSGPEDGAAVHGDSVRDVGESRARPDGGVARAHRRRGPADAVPDRRHHGGDRRLAAAEWPGQEPAQHHRRRGAGELVGLVGVLRLVAGAGQRQRVGRDDVREAVHRFVHRDLLVRRHRPRRRACARVVAIALQVGRSVAAGPDARIIRHRAQRLERAELRARDDHRASHRAGDATGLLGGPAGMESQVSAPSKKAAAD